MEPITVLTFHGKNGSTYRFNVYPKNIRFNKGPALYSFLAKTKEGKYRVLYIGQTIINGLRQHDSDLNTLLFVGE